ncbi:DNA-binding transcriptional ArsR family regulator [Rhodanobacter sp. TND4EL1]
MDEMQAHAAEAASLLKVLAHENRLLVMCHLARGELSVSEINERIALSQSSLSQHLGVLRREGVVVTRRQGQSIFYRLADTGASQIMAVLHDLYCGSAEDRT